jgi:AraC-like DNA-binding protein
MNVAGKETDMTMNLLEYLKSRHPVVKFISLSHDEPVDKTDEHIHTELFQITCFSGGEGYFRLPPKEYKAMRNCFYVVNPNELHSLVAVPKTNFQNASCRFEMPGFKGHLLSPQIQLSQQQAARAYAMMCQIKAYILKDGNLGLIHANLLLTKILLILERNHLKQKQEHLSPVINTAINYISKHYNMGIDIQAVAKFCGVTPAHLSRTFRKETGASPLSYLHRVRIGYVVEKLFRTNMKIADIAIASGYETTKNLNVAFHRAYNMSPTEYRKKYYESGDMNP